MTVIGEPSRVSGTERAFQILTSFLLCTEADDIDLIDEEIGALGEEAIDELAVPLWAAESLEEFEVARGALMDTIYTFTGLLKALIEDVADAYDLDEHSLLAGLAHELYGSERDNS